MSQYQVEGAIKLINDTQTFPSGFSKREFVVTTDHDKYPQDIKFECVKERCAAMDGLSEGQKIIVHFDIRGNEHNGRYYNNLLCWKFEAGEKSATRNEPSKEDLRQDDEGDFDDLPF